MANQIFTGKASVVESSIACSNFSCIVVLTMSSRMRVTKGRRNNRRAHHSVTKETLTTEGDTKVPHIRHRANPVTGMYRGRQVIDVDAKIAKKAAKLAARTVGTEGEKDEA